MPSDFNHGHSLGKGEVESSILSGSTTKPRQIGLSRIIKNLTSATRYGTKREDHVSTRGKSGEYDLHPFTQGETHG